MHLPRRTLRLRLTLLYSGLFLASGALLLTVAYGIVAHNLTNSKPTPASPTLGLLCKSLFSSPKGNPSFNPGTNPSPSPDPKLLSQCRTAFNAGASNQRSDTLHHLLVTSLGALGAMAVVSAGLGWFVAGRALRPLQAITDAARRASHTNFDERLGLTGPPGELKDLADTFDEMLDRLDAAFASQRRFVANASHELRTPLTIMRTAIDVTLAKPARTTEQLEEMALEVRGAIDRAEALIEALLTLARSDRGLEGREPVDLATAAEDALDAARGAIRSSGLEVQSVFEPAPTSGDAVLLERLAANLVDNAVRHNVEPGWIRVTTGQRNGEVFLDVSSSGPSIPAEVAPLLFEPFRRGEAGRGGGLGLGLAIVRSVAAAHEGTVTATSRPNGGLDVSVVLPRAWPESGVLREEGQG